MYCSLDKIDLAATVDGRQVAIQTDHRSGNEIGDQLELSIVFAMTRVLNARESNSTVYYVVSQPPPELVEALRAVGAVISEATSWQASIPVSAVPPIASEQRAGELADDCLRELAKRVAAQVGTRDTAMALRMLEDQTLAAPPSRDTDAAGFWRRVVELAALTGELLRAKAASLGAVGRWVQTDRAVVPFGFELSRPGSATATLFPTNRAHRVIEVGRDGDERMMDLLAAAEEALERPQDPATGRLMPSLRDRANVELDETVWQPLVPDGGRAELPIIVCGIDGESTFGMIRREALQRAPDDAMAEALANLAAEDIEIGQWHANDIPVLAISGSFYAAEKLLDRSLMRELHDAVGTPMLYAGVPARGVLLVAAGDEALRARFAMLVRARYDDAGGRQISPVVLMIEDGVIAGFVRDTAHMRPDTAPIRADTKVELGSAHSDLPERPSVQIRRRGLLRRLLGRK